MLKNEFPGLNELPVSDCFQGWVIILCKDFILLYINHFLLILQIALKSYVSRLYMGMDWMFDWAILG